MHTKMVCSKTMATEQLAIRIPESLVAQLDDLVARGIYDSRAAAVRAGVEAIIELERRHGIDRAVIDGYRRIPPTQAERDSALASLREAILDEPW